MGSLFTTFLIAQNYFFTSGEEKKRLSLGKLYILTFCLLQTQANYPTNTFSREELTQESGHSLCSACSEERAVSKVLCTAQSFAPQESDTSKGRQYVCSILLEEGGPAVHLYGLRLESCLTGRNATSLPSKLSTWQ